MNLPKYQLKFPEEALWIAWLGGFAGLVSVILLALGVDPGIVTATATFIMLTGRVITGSILPEPTVQEAIDEAIDEAT